MTKGTTIPATLIQAGTGEDGETTITFSVEKANLEGFILNFYQEMILSITRP